MIKKSVTYTDYDGKQRTEDLYFHLNKIELTELDLDYDGKLSDHIHYVVEKQDSKEIYRIFKELILKAYGVKSEDGRSFRKNARIREEFENSEAFATFFYDLMTSNDEKELEAFTRGVLPADVNV